MSRPHNVIEKFSCYVYKETTEQVAFLLITILALRTSNTSLNKAENKHLPGRFAENNLARAAIFETSKRESSIV